MRKTLTALMFATALPTLAMAAAPEGAPQNGPGFDAPPPPPAMMHHRGDRDGKGGPGGPFGKLDLTPEQRQQVGHLMGEEMRNRRELTDKYLHKLPAADQKAYKDELKSNHDKTESSIRGLLKPEQQKKFDEMKKREDQRRAEWAEFQTWKAEKAKQAK